MKSQYPISLLCEALNCPRSSYYYQSQRQEKADLREELDQVLMHYPRYGYRRVTAQLQCEGWPAGTTLVRRQLKQLGVSRTVARVKVCTTDSHHAHLRYPNLIKGLKIAHPDQVWVAHIIYLRSRQGASQGQAVDSPFRGLRRRSVQGSQYAAWLHGEKLLAAQVKISMSETGKPRQNSRVERFFRSLKEELIDFVELHAFDAAWAALETGLRSSTIPTVFIQRWIMPLLLSLKRPVFNVLSNCSIFLSRKSRPSHMVGRTTPKPGAKKSGCIERSRPNCSPAPPS